MPFKLLLHADLGAWEKISCKKILLAKYDCQLFSRQSLPHRSAKDVLRGCYLAARAGQ